MTGFYGKLPAKGDFLSRNLPRAFVDIWDDWLQTGMHESRQALGDDWLQIYLTSPLWRFILPPGACTDSAWAGVLMPSMDKVGRYFPMAVVTPLPTPFSSLATASSSQSWFESIEACLLGALEDEALDLDAFDQQLQGLLIVEEKSAALELAGDVDQGVRIALDDELSIPRALMRMTVASLEHEIGTHSIWWGQGSERIPPSLVICRGLPGPGKFTALLDGNWSGHGWCDKESLSPDVASIIADIATI